MRGDPAYLKEYRLNIHKQFLDYSVIVIGSHITIE